MNKYYDNLNDEVKEYFSILSPEFPEWLLEYIDTPEMERIGKISMSCGTDYSKCFNVRYWYSNLEHSVGVALIIWHFTHDKKQTLAGLFHDIATPVFKHCIDFMNGDSETQESTEERTTDIIKKSKEIMSLLERDGIKLEEVIKLYSGDNELKNGEIDDRPQQERKKPEIMRPNIFQRILNNLGFYDYSNDSNLILPSQKEVQRNILSLVVLISGIAFIYYILK